MLGYCHDYLGDWVGEAVSMQVGICVIDGMFGGQFVVLVAMMWWRTCDLE